MLGQALPKVMLLVLQIESLHVTKFLHATKLAHKEAICQEGKSSVLRDLIQANISDKMFAINHLQIIDSQESVFGLGYSARILSVMMA